MTSEPLTNCINCGHQVSIKANRCPHCNSELGECCICHKPIKKDDLIKSRHFHLPCMAKNFQVPPSLCCPDCKRPFEGPSLADSIVKQEKSYDGRGYESLSRWWKCCPNCGSPDPLSTFPDKCAICFMPIMKTFQTHVEQCFYKYGDDYGRIIHHQFCRPRDPYRGDPSNNVTHQEYLNGRNSFPNWTDGYLHWMVGKEWYSNAPPKVDKTNGCFIATAAYGTSTEPDVQILRDYRDTVLATNSFGRFISVWYARLSPAVAKRIHAESVSGVVVRACLSPIVAVIKYLYRTQ